MKSFKFKGFILGSREWREKDKLITIFTCNQGKIKVLAKGVRNLKSKRAGSLSTGTYVKAICYKSQENSIPILGELEVMSQYIYKNSNLRLITTILYLSEITDCLVPENQPEPKLFFFLKQTFAEVFVHNKFDSITKYSVELPYLLGFGMNEKAKQFYISKKIKLAQEEAERFICSITDKKIRSLSIMRT
jgi:DNA repair protein RecO (recombination protein O)